MSDLIKNLTKTTEYIRSKCDLNPKIALTLGSGLGAFADNLEDKVVIPYSEIPGFHQTSVLGHDGALVFGKLGNVEVACMKGRIHAYEGHAIDQVVYPVRVLAHLGVEKLILTNASGGVNTGYRPGQLVLIEDHINLSGLNPLVGKNHDELGPRFPDMTFTYHQELREKMQEIAKSMNYDLVSGVYAGVLGPSYETPAEVKMIRTLGGDLVGMSTVNEAIAAHHAGLKVVGVSCVTNMAAGILKEKLSHHDIEKEANKAMKVFIELISKFIQSN